MFFSLNAMNQMELTDRLALVCIPVILLLVAMLMPRKNKVFSVVVRALMIVLLAGVAVFGLVSPLADLIGTTARISFIPVVMLVEALFLLWGLLFPDAYLTQGLYGLICSVPLAAGLLGFIFPTWLSAAAFIDVFYSAESILAIAQYAALVFVPLYLIVSGAYRMRLSSAWHALFGMTFLGSLLLTLVRADLITSPAYDTLSAILPSFENFAFGTDALKDFGILTGAAVVLALLAGLIATVCRRSVCHTDEKFSASETRGALVTRLVGRIFSGIGSLALLVLTPALIDLMGLTGTAATLFCLVPIAFMLLVQLFVEFAAEDTEIKHAQAATANA